MGSVEGHTRGRARVRRVVSGCVATLLGTTALVTLSASPASAAPLGPTFTQTPSSPVAITAAGTLTWQFSDADDPAPTCVLTADGVSNPTACSADSPVSYAPTTPGVYSLTVTDVNGAVTDTVTVVADTPTFATTPGSSGTNATPAWTFGSLSASGTTSCVLADPASATIDTQDPCGSSYTAPTLTTLGTYTLQVSQTDNGQTSDPVSSTYQLDALGTPPVAPTVTAETAVGSTRTPRFDIDGVVGGATLNCTVTPPSGGPSVSVTACAPDVSTLDLAGGDDGTYTFSETQTVGGLVSSAGTSTYTLDSAVAKPTIVAAATVGQAPSASFTVGNLDSDATLECSVDGPSGSTPTVTDCDASTDIDLTGQPGGTYTVSVHAKDAVGNTSGDATATYTYLPGPPPPVTVDGPTVGKDVTPSYTVADTEDVPLTYVCDVPGQDDSQVITQCGTTTKLDLSQVADGTLTLTVSAVDQLSNVSDPTTVSYTLDTVTPAPDVSLASPAASPGSDSSPSFTIADGETVSAPDGFTCKWEGPDGSTISNSTCASGDSFATAGDGAYTMTVTATDAVGNVATAAPVTYVLEAGTPPTPTVTGPAAGDGKATFTVTDAESVDFTYSCTVVNSSGIALPAAVVTQCGPTTKIDVSGKPDDVYTVSVTVTDSLGHTSLAGATDYLLDTSAQAPTVSLSSPLVSPSNATMPQFTIVSNEILGGQDIFTCEWDDPTGTAISTGGCDSGDAFPANQGDGVYTLKVAATDTTGNVSASVGTATYTLDTIGPAAPSVTLTTPASSPGNATKPTFTVTDSDGSATFTCSAVGINTGTSVTVAGADCGATTTVDLSSAPDDTYTLSVAATDAAGNPSLTAGTATYTLDTGTPPAPSVTLATPATSPGKATSPTFDVTDTEVGVTFSCSAVGATTGTVITVLPAACGATTTVDLSSAPDDTYTLSVTAKDVAGNTSALAGTAVYELDRTAPPAPSVTLATPANSPGKATKPTFTVTDSDASATFTCSAVGINTGTSVAIAAADCGGTTTVDLSSAPDDTYTLSVTATDAAGNPSLTAGTASYTLDTSPPPAPSVTLATPASSPGNVTTPTFTVTDSDSGVSAYSCSAVGINTATSVMISAADCGATTTVDLSSAPDDTYTLSVTAIDAAGNSSATAGTATYTLDTSLPPAPSVTLATPPTSPGKSTSPTFDVTDTEVGVTFSCSAVGTNTGTVIMVLPAACGATTTVDLSSAPDDTYTLSVTATDTAGNDSATAGTATYELDQAPPPAPSVTLATPASSPGNATKPTFTVTDTDPSVTFTCSVAGTRTGITITIMPVYCGSTTTVDLASAADDIYTLSVTATDAAGNASVTAGTASYELDQTAPPAPSVTLATPTSSPGNATKPTFTVTDSDTSATFTCSAVGTTTGTSVTVAGADCGATTTVDLSSAPDDTYTLSVTATDAAGNPSLTAGTATYTLDTTLPPAPSVSLATPATSPGHATAPTFTVTDSDPDPGLRFTCWITGATTATAFVVPAADCSATTTVDLSTAPDDTYTLSVTATDAAGNTSALAGTAVYELDQTAPPAPSVTLATPASSPGKATKPTFTVTDTDPSATFTCTAANASNIALTAADIICGATTTVDLSSAPDDTYTLSVTATDAAGNPSATAGTATYTLDTSPPPAPSVTLATPASSPGHVTTPTFTVTDSDGSATFTCSALGTTTGTSVTVSAADCGASTTVDLSSAPDDTYTLSVTATDAAGNPSLTAGTATYTLDTSPPPAPSVSRVSPVTSPGKSTSPKFDVTDTEVGVTFSCSAVGTNSGTVITILPAACGTTTTLNLSSAPDDIYTLSVTATDVAGNVSLTAGTATYELDNAPPPAPTVTLATPASSPGKAKRPTFTVTDADPSATFTCTAANAFNVAVPAAAITCGATTTLRLAALGDGTYTLSVIATDAAGNSSATAGTATYTLDGTTPDAPTVTTVTPTPGTSTSPTFTVTNPGDTSPGGLTYACTASFAANAAATPSPVAAALITCGPTYGLNLAGQPDGRYILSVVATDAVGNTGAAGTALYELDTTLPDSPTVTRATPPSSPGSVTSPTFTVSNPGDLSPGALAYTCTATYQASAAVTPSPVAAALISCGPTTSLSLATVGDGDYVLYVTATDSAGNVSALPGSATYTLDATAPATPIVTLTSPATSPGTATSLQFTVTNPGDSSPGGLTYSCSVSGPTPVPAIACGPTTTFDVSGPGRDGVYTLSVTATDLAGNVSAVAGTAQYALDTTAPGAPTVRLSNPSSSPGHITTPQFAVTNVGDVSPGGVTYSCVAVKTSVLPNLTLPAADVSCGPTTSLNLSATGDGDYALSVTATDKAGNVGSAAGMASYTLDTSAPPAPVVVVPKASTKLPTFVISDGDPTAVLTCQLLSPQGQIVFPTGADATCPADGTFDTTSFADGDYTLTVTATDPAGNATSVTVTWTRDTTPPPVPTVIAPGSPSNDTTPTFTIADSEAGAVLTCVLNGPDSATTIAFMGTCPADGTITIDGPDGFYVLTVTAADVVGNVQPTTASASYILDTNPPNSPTVVRTVPAISNIVTPTFTVTDPDSSPGGISFQCSVSGPTPVPAGAITCGALTSFDLSGVGRDGVYVLSVTATDAAQNVSLHPGTATYQLDTTAPPAPTITLSAPASSPGNLVLPTFTVSDADTSPGMTFSCSGTGITPVPDSAITCGPTTSVDLSGTDRDGSYTLSATATDAAGNISATAGSATYVLDTLAPLAPVTQLATSSPSSSIKPLWIWQFGVNDVATALDTASCTINGPAGWSTTVACGHHFSPKLTGRDGAYTATVTLTDEAGNSASSTSIIYTLDSTAPGGTTLFLKHPSTFSGLDRHPVWGIRGPIGSTLLCTLLRGDKNGAPVTHETVCKNPATYTLDAHDDGMYTLQVIAVDRAGNRSPGVWSSYVLAPLAPHVHAPSSGSAQATWSVVGNSSDRYVCTLSRDGVAVAGPATCGSAPTYDMSRRPAGTYVLSVIQVGDAGAQSAPGSDLWVWVGHSTVTPPPGGSQGPGQVGPHHNGGNPPDKVNPITGLPGFVRHELQQAAHHPGSLLPPPSSFIPPVHPGRATDVVSSAARTAVHALGSAGGGTGFPLFLVALVLVFLIAQNRIDRRDPKLALASIAADDMVEFVPPPSRKDRP